MGGKPAPVAWTPGSSSQRIDRCRSWWREGSSRAESLLPAERRRHSRAARVRRREDILELAVYFLARHRATRDLTIADAALDALRLYDWPGNVRELERLMERAVTLVASNRIELEDLPPHVCGRYGEVLGPSIAASESMRAWGSRYARLIFERCGRNKRAAARTRRSSITP